MALRVRFLGEALSPTSRSASNTTVSSNSTLADSTTCELSPQAQFLSTVLTAFIGSIVGGVCGGPFIPFYAAWISWLATLRIILTGIWQLCEAGRLRPLLGGDQFHAFWARIPILRRFFSEARNFDDPFFRDGAARTEPTVLGWVSWLWAACYTPVSQTLWLVANWKKSDSSSAGLRIVRALGVSVNALPLTMDTKARYGEALKRTFGTWSRAAFTFIHAASCMILGIISAIELILGAIDGKLNWWVIAIYVLLLIIWAGASFVFCTPHDEEYYSRGFQGIIAGFGMGCFGGVFLAAPALSMMQNAPNTPGQGIYDYLRCERVSMWKKFTAVCP